MPQAAADSLNRLFADGELAFLAVALIALATVGVALIVWDTSTRQKFTQLGIALVSASLASGVIWAMDTVSNQRLHLISERLELTLAGPTLKLHKLPGERLAGLDFSGRALDRSRLSHVTLEDISFQEARLIGASFFGAHFTERVDMTGADLCGVDLREADMTGVIGLKLARRLDRAWWDDATKWPEGMAPPQPYVGESVYAYLGVKPDDERPSVIDCDGLIVALQPQVSVRARRGASQGDS